MIESKFSIYDDFGPIQASIRISDEPYKEGKYAPYLHIRAYHTNRKTIKITPCDNEIIEMDVPKKFKRADLETFISINGKKILERLRDFLDAERKNPPELLTYDSKVPFFGKYIPIQSLPDENNSGGYFDNDFVYIQAGLSSDAIHDAVLGLLGDIAYGILKKRLDHYASIMDVRYSRFEIDDGRRTWGSYNQETRVIFLSRRILMMSERIIDSLIIHELAHIKVFMHNEELYDEILKIMPDYDEIDDAFFEAAGKLFEQGWI